MQAWKLAGFSSDLLHTSWSSSCREALEWCSI